MPIDDSDGHVAQTQGRHGRTHHKSRKYFKYGAESDADFVGGRAQRRNARVEAYDGRYILYRPFYDGVNHESRHAYDHNV